MSKLTPSSASEECFCGNKNGNCRRGHDIYLCMTFADLGIGQTINGYKNIKRSKDGLWGIFKLDNSQEWSDEQREKWRLETERRKQQQKFESDFRQQKSLSAIDRDKEYRKLLDELTLHPEDEKELLRRGFTHQEIKLGGWKSVDRYQELKQKYSNLLPGISPKGNIILTNAGWLCPIRNKDGLIVAIQVRLRVVATGEGRYRYLSSRTKTNPNGQSPHVYPQGANHGELPLAVFYPQNREVTGIAIVEGTGVKPFFVAQRLGMLTIGAAGGLWASSPVTFKESLEHLSEKFHGMRQLTIFVDAGDVLNKLVMDRWQKVVKLLQDWNWTVRIAWWDQVSKNHHDIDELPPEKIKDIGYVTPDYFWELAKEERTKVSLSKVLLENEDLPHGHAQNWQMWLNSRKYTPDIIQNQDEFTFPEVPESNVIVAVKSGLGTRKTGAMILKMLEASKGVRLIGYRNNLLFQTIRRADGKVKLYHLNGEDAGNLISDEDTHLVFCLDSIRKVDGYFVGRDIYLDEACSVLLHAVNGGTLGNNQPEVLKIFTRALQVCNRIFLLDGNLSDIYVDFVAKLAKGKRVIKIENQKKIPAHDIKFIVGIDPEGEVKRRDKSSLVEHLVSAEVKPFIATDSKEFSKVLDRLLRDLGQIGFCLNSETAGEDWAKEFMDDPDSFIAYRKPDYIIVSPTAESGVSIETKYFTEKLTFFAGVQATNAQHQIMFRLRDNSIPHYVVCPEYSSIENRSTPRTYEAKKHLEILNNRIDQSAMMAAYSSDNPERVLDVISQAYARQQDEWWYFSGQLGVLDHFEMQNLRLCLIHALEEAGHRVQIEEWDTSKYAAGLIKETKEAVQREHAVELFLAQPYKTIKEADDLAKFNQRKPIQRRIEKTRLLDRLLEIEKSPVYSADFIYETYIKDKHLISQHQLFYFLNNPEVSEKRHEVDWYYRSTSLYFYKGRAKKDRHLDTWALLELNVLQFLSGEWHKDLPEVIAFIEKARQPEIVKALNIRPKPESATGGERIEYISKLLALIGLKFAKPEQKMIDGVRQRVYHIDSEIISDPYRLAVLEAIEKKMKWWMAEKSQVDWNDELLSRPTPPPPDTASCPLHTTHPIYKDQVGGVQAEVQVQQDFNSEQPNPIPTEINTSPALHTTHPIYKDQGSGVQAETPVQQAFNLEEWMTQECLEDIAEYLEIVATSDSSETVDEESKPLVMLKGVRACMPPEALKAAANLLPKPLRKRIAEMVRLLNPPVETKPTSEPKPVAVTPHLPQVSKTDKPPAPALSKEEEAFAEWSQLQNLIKVANEFLAPLAKLLPDQAIQKIKHILTFVPSKAVGLAAELLTGSPRDNLKPLLLTFDIAIE